MAEGRYPSDFVPLSLCIYVVATPRLSHSDIPCPLWRKFSMLIAVRLPITKETYIWYVGCGKLTSVTNDGWSPTCHM